MKRSDYQPFIRNLVERGFTEIDLELIDESEKDKEVILSAISPGDELIIFSLSSWMGGSIKLTYYRKSSGIRPNFSKPESTVELRSQFLDPADGSTLAPHHITLDVTQRAFDLLWKLHVLNREHEAQRAVDSSSN